MSAAGAGILSRLLRVLRVTLGIEQAPKSRAIRSMTVALVTLGAFALVGNAVFVNPLRHAAEKPFEFDWALRTLSLGWFDESRTLPIALVEMDEATYRAWGSPAQTPRAALARMLEIVTRSAPAAVVVDVDLAFGADIGSDPLAAFLRAYAGTAPIVFPRRIEVAEDGSRRPVPSPFDAMFAAHPKLHWAHASFATEQGVVREWEPWLAVCAGDEVQMLPAVATRLAEVLPGGWHGLRPAPSAPAATSCAGESADAESVLIGPRLTGPEHPTLMREASLVPAHALLDPALDRDDAAYFEGRIVFVGATHAGSGDHWVTSSGVLPGVELMANTVRFLPLQEAAGPGAEPAYRVVTIVAFALIGFLFWLFRPSIALLVLIPASLALVALAVGGWGYFRVFDACAAALLLVVQVKTLEAGLTLVEDWRRYGWRRTLLARHFRTDDDDDEE